ncbi:uncharacterized protein RBU33_022257 [Hipposideros larvatus]
MPALVRTRQSPPAWVGFVLAARLGRSRCPRLPAAGGRTLHGALKGGDSPAAPRWAFRALICHVTLLPAWPTRPYAQVALPPRLWQDFVPRGQAAQQSWAIRAAPLQAELQQVRQIKSESLKEFGFQLAFSRLPDHGLGPGVGASAFPRPQAKEHHGLPCSPQAWLQHLGCGRLTGPQGAEGGGGAACPGGLACSSRLWFGRRPLDGPVHVFILQPVRGEGLRRRSDPGSNPAPSSETDLCRLCSCLCLPLPGEEQRWTLWSAPGPHGRGLHEPPPHSAASSCCCRKVQAVPCPTAAPCTAPRHPSSGRVPPATPGQSFLTLDLETPVAISSFAGFSGQSEHHARNWAENGWKLREEKGAPPPPTCPQQRLELRGSWQGARGKVARAGVRHTSLQCS